MKIFLVNPPFIEAYGQYKAAAKVGAQPQMPLGLAYIAATFEKMGHEVVLIDSDVEEMSVNDVIESIKNFAPNIVGVSSTTPIYNSASMILETVKKHNPDIITILGGNHMTALPQKTMEENSSIDIGVVGEGEETVEELLSAIEKNKSFEKIKGILYRKDSKIVSNERRGAIKEIDEIPLPARHLLKTEKYKWSVPDKGIVTVTSITSQRGCPFKCIFCGVNTMFPGATRYRDISKVVDELEDVNKKFKIDHFMFCDDTLTLNKNKVIEMCDEIAKRKLKITFEGYTRANTITKELLITLKKAGLVRLSFGIESGNPEILKAIKKGITTDELKRAYEWCDELSIETRGSLMIGHPFETKETVDESMKFVNSLKCYQMYVNVTTPYPGSELYDLAKENYGGLKLLTEDWKEYRRYGNAVMEMNDLSADNLIELQQKAYKKFYFRPHIIWYNLKRAGLKAGFVNSLAFMKTMFTKKRN